MDLIDIDDDAINSALEDAHRTIDEQNAEIERLKEVARNAKYVIEYCDVYVGQAFMDNLEASLKRVPDVQG